MLNHIQSLLSITVPHLSWPDFTVGDIQTFGVLGAFAVLFAMEARWGYRRSPAKTVRQSYLTNLSVFIFNDTLVSLMSVSSLWLLAERMGHWGLLSSLSDPIGKGLLSFLLLDLTLYFWHRVNHRYECLWIFHKVHHSDACMNVSTAFRLHFVEVVLTVLVKAAFILIAGVDSAVVLANEAVITLFVLFHHANIRFTGENWLGRLMIVPYLHRAHHSTRRQEHDNNYGAVFSFWDRMFGTLAEDEPVEIGLKHRPGEGLIELVKFGLTKALPPAPQFVERMIAEAAYYRAEKRGFLPGHDFIDWIEAEKEITAKEHR